MSDRKPSSPQDPIESALATSGTDEGAWDTALRALFSDAEEPIERAAAESVLAMLSPARFELDLRRPEGAMACETAGEIASPSMPRPLIPRVVEIDLRAGRIGRLQLLREIARGGVGVVLEAYDPDLGRRVAVKVLREELAGNFSLVQRFVEEAQIGGQLQHPGIVPVYELGLDATRRPYFAMRLVEGRTLAVELSAAPRLEDRGGWLAVFERVCQTIAYAHARGVIHRDLKPQNIMIGAYGDVLVMDWGLAKVLGTAASDRDATSDQVSTLRQTAGHVENPHLSQSGERLGTPAYMAPEQESGDRERVDERADVWALGVMLFEIVSGESWRQREAPHADASVRLQDLPIDAQLRTLLSRCLHPDIENRPRHAGEVAAELGAHLAAAEARARAAEVAAAAADTRSRAERKAKRLGLSLAAALAAALLLAVLFVSDRRERYAALRSQVESSIASSTVARRSGEHVTAIAALDRAAGALSAAGADDESLQLALANERTLVEHEARIAELRSKVLRLRTSLGPIHALEETFAHFFSELGVEDLDERTASVEQCAQALIESAPELRAELAATLFDWGQRRRRQGEPFRRFQKLFELGMAIDDDPTRRALRTALSDRQLEALRQAAQVAEADDAPLATIHTAAEGFEVLGQPEEARALLERAVERAPDDLWTRWQLVRLLMRGDVSERKDAEVHAAVARALHPDHLDPMMPPDRGPGAPRRDGPPPGRPPRHDD